ncbi:MAG: sulfotransferase [Chloroflexota bacterium]
MTESLLEQKMIIVVGNSRSGTTMLGRILGRAAQVYTFNELHFFEQVWQPQLPPAPVTPEQAATLFARLVNVQRDGYFEQGDLEPYRGEAESALAGVDEPLTPPLVYAAFAGYEAGRFGKSIPCDQTPRNLYYVQEILDLYPNAVVVNILRDPRGVLLSQKNRWRRRSMSGGGVPLGHLIRQWVDYHPITISLIWKAGVAAYERVTDHPRVVGLRFEDLVSDPETTIRRVCAAAGIPFEAGMLDVPQVGSSLKRDAPDRRGINREVAEQWRKGGLSRTDLWISQRVTRAAMARHGYRPDPIRPNGLALAWSGLTWVVKSGLAFLFNFRRSRNPFKAVARRLGFGK